MKLILLGFVFLFSVSHLSNQKAFSPLNRFMKRTGAPAAPIKWHSFPKIPTHTSFGGSRVTYQYNGVASGTVFNNFTLLCDYLATLNPAQLMTIYLDPSATTDGVCALS